MFQNINGIVEIDKDLTKSAQKRAEWVKKAMTPPTTQIDNFNLSLAKQIVLECYTMELTGFDSYLAWVYAENDRLWRIESELRRALKANDAMAVGTLIIERKAFAVAPSFCGAQG
jgi:hypothetical protein